MMQPNETYGKLREMNGEGKGFWPAVLLAGGAVLLCCGGHLLVVFPAVSSGVKGYLPLLVGLVALAATSLQAQAGKGMHKAPDFLVTAKSSYGFDDTVSMIKGAVEQSNLMVVHEIDAQKMLRMVGEKAKGMKQVLFFHPRFLKTIRAANPNGAIEAPMKILVMEIPDGTVMVRYAKPTYLLGRYGALDDVASELESIVEKIVAEVR